MAFSLSQVDRKARTYNVTTLLNGATVPPSGSVGLGLVPKYSQSPTAATVWTPVAYSSGSFSVLFAGPQADSTGAIVVTADADLWMLETDAPLVQAVKIERITVLGSSAVLPSLPSTYVTSVNGKSGVTALTFSDVGADAAGAATAAQAAAIAAAATDATTKANSAQSAAIAAIPSMSTIAADAALRAAFVATIGLANGSDDTAKIQGLLTAARTAGGGLVKGTPGQAYQLSAPLIIGSSTTLDMTGCTVTLKAGSNCNMVNNFTVTAQRTVADGAMTSGSTTLTSATAAFTSADVGRSVYVAGAAVGGYLLVSTIASVTNTTTAVLNLAPSTTVSAASVTLFDRDTKIAVIGGAWARGSNAGTGTANHSLRFRHVDTLTIRQITATESAGKYFINPGDCTDVLVDDIRGVNLASNLVQPTGPISGMTVSNISGTSQDDLVAFVAQDYVAYADTIGDMVDIAVRNVRSVNGNAAIVKIMGGPAAGVKRITVDGIYGTLTTNSQGAIFIGDDAAQVNDQGGRLEGITLRNLRATPPNNVPMVFCNGTNVGDITLDGLTWKNAAAATSAIAVVTRVAATIGSLVIRNVRAPAFGAQLINIASPSTVTRLVLDDVEATSTSFGKVVNVAAGATVTDMTVSRLQFVSSAANTYGVYVAGTIGALKIDHGRWVPSVSVSSALVFVLGSIGDLHIVGTQGSPSVGAYMVQLDPATASAAISRFTVSGVHVAGTGAGGGLITAATAGHTLPLVNIAATYLDNISWIADLNTTTELRMAALSASNLSSGAFNVRAAAVLTLRGDGVTAITATVTAGGVVTSRSFGIQIDASKLTKTANHMAYNTNAGLSCGVGPIVCDGTNWKHLFTAATY